MKNRKDAFCETCGSPKELDHLLSQEDKDEEYAYYECSYCRISDEGYREAMEMKEEEKNART
jgi:DNA-directed RNA polymerase subunit RPC12/RpoP